MSDVTLKTHMILADGIHYRGSVIDSNLVPSHLQKDKYLVKGRKPISKVSNQVELEEITVDTYPMKELTLDELSATSELEPKKLIRRR